MVARGRCFNGVNQSVRVLDHSEVNFFGDCSLDVADPLTIDVWVKTCGAGVQPIVDKRQSGVGFLQGYYLFILDGRLGFQMATGAGNFVCGSPGSACTDYLSPIPSPFVSGVDLSDNRWHHVAVVVTRCHAGVGQMYIDGNQVQTFTPRVGDIANTADLLIGTSYPIQTSATFLQGCLDELEFFNRDLDVAEIGAIYNAGWAGKCKPSIACSGGNGSRCMTALNKAGVRVARAQGKDVRECFKKGADGDLGGQTAQACLSADNSGRVAKATSKTLVSETQKCAGVATCFGPADAASVNTAAMEEDLALVEDLFGPDLNAALAPTSVDPVAARCQKTVVKGYEKLLQTKLKAFVKCKEQALKDGAADSSDLAGCVHDATRPDSIAASAGQPTGKVALGLVKFTDEVASKCSGVSIPTSFPGLCSSVSLATLPQCIDRRVEGRVCRMLNGADRLGVDCDDFDDKIVNASCEDF